MKILVTSDWHLDEWFGADALPFHPQHFEGLDALIIAGDLTEDPLHQWPAYLNWLGRLIDPAKVHILPGNHDYYGHRLDGDATLHAVVEAAGMHFAQKQALIFGDVRFLCCTLWSDFGLFGTPERSMLDARRMEDFSRIQRDAHGELIQPEDLRAAHQDHLDWLTRQMEIRHSGRTVVVTHHQPSSVIGGRPTSLSPFFVSNLEDWIRAHTPDLWLCGHAHRRLQGRVGTTWIRDVSFGYPHEVEPDQVTGLLRQGLIDTEAASLLVE